MAIAFQIVISGASDDWYGGVPGRTPIEWLQSKLLEIFQPLGLNGPIEDGTWLVDRDDNYLETGSSARMRGAFVLYKRNKELVTVPDLEEAKRFKAPLDEIAKYILNLKQGNFALDIRMAHDFLDTSSGRLSAIIDPEFESMSEEELLAAAENIKGLLTPEKIEELKGTGRWAQLETSQKEIERDIETERRRAEQSAALGREIGKVGRPRRKVISQEEWDQTLESIAFNQPEEDLRSLAMDEFAKDNIVEVTEQEYQLGLLEILEEARQHNASEIEISELQAEYKRNHRISRLKMPTRSYPSRSEKERPWTEFEDKDGILLWEEKTFFRGRDPEGQLIMKSMADMSEDPMHIYSEEELQRWRYIYSRWRNTTEEGRESIRKYNRSGEHRDAESRYRRRLRELTDPTTDPSQAESYPLQTITGEWVDASTYNPRLKYEKSDKGRTARQNYNELAKGRKTIREQVKKNIIEVTGRIPGDNEVNRIAAPLLWDSGLVRSNQYNTAWGIYDIEQGDPDQILEGGIVETPKDRYLKFVRLQYADNRGEGEIIE